MKNLYIYILDFTGRLKKETWEDVCVTKKGEIVKKRNKQYDLTHGKYRREIDLNKYSIRFDFYEKKIIDVVIYISLKDDCDIAKLKEPFIEEFEKEIEYLKSKLEMFKDLK